MDLCDTSSRPTPRKGRPSPNRSISLMLLEDHRAPTRPMPMERAGSATRRNYTSRWFGI